MRIISKFHDYYDSVMSYGQDESCIYLRKTVEYDLREKSNPQLIKDIKEIIDKHAKKPEKSWRSGNITRLSTINTKHYKYEIEPFNVLFCGKLYKGVSIDRSSQKTDTYCHGETTYLYSSDAVKSYMEKHGIPNEDIKAWWHKNKLTTYSIVESYFKEITQPDLNWMIANKVICILDSERADGVDIITVNPCLRNVQFYKVFEAYSAFQELDMWVSGTLAYPQNEMVEIDDKYKVQQHGFDEKYGFRKRPEKVRI
jgi:hypothetical protein